MLNLAYVAGLFDGEGCVSLRKGKATPGTSATRPGSEYRDLLVCIGMTHEEIVTALYRQFSGYLYKEKRHEVHHKDLWTWQLTSDRAATFLTDVKPWLVVKSEQADIALEYQATRIPRSRRHLGVPDDLVTKRAELHRRLTALNKRGI